MRNEEQIAEAVAAGAAFLDDKVGPEWIARVDLGRLDMSSIRWCVAAQVFGDWYGMDEAALADGFDVQDLGFDSSTESFREDNESAEYNMLHNAWVELIENRRNNSQ